MSRFGEAGRNLRRNPKGREGEYISEAWMMKSKDRNLTERRIFKKIPFPVTIAKGFHLFPSRTQKLSPSASMVLGWRRPGRVDRCRIPIGKANAFPIFLSSSMAEHPAVNRRVVGSSPTWGATSGRLQGLPLFDAETENIFSGTFFPSPQNAWSSFSKNGLGRRSESM